MTPGGDRAQAAAETDETGSSDRSLALPKDAPGLTRRDRARIATSDEIKTVARSLLAPQQGGDLSLRAVAREVGMTPSAIYRYFESRQDLMEAVGRDAYDSVASALQRAMDDVTEEEKGGVRLAHAYRDWCIEHPAEFALIFRYGGADGGDAREDSPTRPHVLNFYRVPLELMVAGIRDGSVVAPMGLTQPVDIQPEMLAIAQSVAAEGVRPEVIALLAGAWASIHGFICLEIFGHMGLIVTDLRESFDRHVRFTLASIGVRDL